MERLTGVLTAAGADRVWVAAFCYLRCGEGLLFFAFVIDVWPRRVVSWRLAGHMRTDPVLDALRMALSRRAHGVDVEFVDHSDAVSQYTSYAFTRVLGEHAGSTPVDRAGRSTTGHRWISSKRSSLRPRATTCRLRRLHTSMKIGTENPVSIEASPAHSR